MHAPGEVHYDSNGSFGEALDIAFRLLDAPGVKKVLQAAADPLTLVISGDIYRTVVRHEYDGIDPLAFRPLIRVNVAGYRYPGWIHTPRNTARLRVTEIASYKQSALFHPAFHAQLVVAYPGGDTGSGRSDVQPERQLVAADADLGRSLHLLGLRHAPRRHGAPDQDVCLEISRSGRKRSLRSSVCEPSCRARRRIAEPLA
jgi:hypothetical protein